MVNKPFPNSLGAQLRALRKRLHLNQADVSQKTGVSIPALRKMERGNGNIPTWTKVLAGMAWNLRGKNLPVAETLGDQVALLRKRQKISQRALASMVGVTQPTVIGIEVRNTGRLSTLNAILTVLGAGPTLIPAGETASFYTHTANSSAFEAWTTPAWLLERLHQVFGTFDLDPCSSTKDRRLTRVKARAYFTSEDDGLSLPWTGTVFLNPPYGRQIKLWTSKAHREHSTGNAQTVIALVPARTDTLWWHTDIAGKATVFFIKGRLSFGDGSQPAPFPSALVIWGLTEDLAAKLKSNLPEAWAA